MKFYRQMITKEEIIRIKEALHYLDENGYNLSDNGRSFVLSLRKYFSKNKTLSERQIKALLEIRENLPE